MAEAVVEQKPTPHLPYDPNDIPEAVKKRAAAIDALYKQPVEAPPAASDSNGSQPPPVPETNGSNGAQQAAPPAEPTGSEQLNLPLEDAPVVQAPSSPQLTTHSVPADPAPEDENSGNWKLRYERMHGRYNASQKTIGELQEQMTQMGQELLHLQRMPPPPRSQPVEAPRYITEKDVQDYGTDLVDFTRRAAVDAVAPHLQTLEQRNAELQRQLAREARARMDMRVEAAVPNYREIDRDPRWRNWLLGIDMLSGRVRQTLLDEAIASADAPRAISFFKGFLNEGVATGHSEPAPNSHQPAAPREAAIDLGSLAAPGRARPATGGDAFSGGLPDKPIYTRAQIAKLYDAHRRGAFVGREAEWARQDADIIRAGAEGRVRN